MGTLCGRPARHADCGGVPPLGQELELQADRHPRGGVSFTVATTIGLPLHYYLSIVGLDQRIGCAEVYRNNNRIGVQFIREIDEDTLRTVVRAGYFTGGGTEKSRPNACNRAGSTEWIAQGAALT